MSSKARWIVEDHAGFRWQRGIRRKFYTPDEALEYMGPEWAQVLEVTDTRIRNTRTGQVIYIAEVNLAA